MSEQPTRQTRAIAVVALVGVVASALATAVSYWDATGETPAWLYGAPLWRLSSLWRVWGVPVEFLDVVWLTAIALLTMRPGRPFGSAVHLTFLTSIPMLGLSLWLCWSFNFPCYTVMVAAAAGLVILLTSSWHTLPLRTFIATLRLDMRQLSVNPLTAVGCTVFVSVSLIGGEFMALKTTGMPARLAAEQPFRTWYAAQRRFVTGDLVVPHKLRVVVFTDYECPACSQIVPFYEASVSTYRRAYGEMVDLQVRDFPLDPECNPAVRLPEHQMACEEAAAVRLVRQEQGGVAAADFSRWLYQHQAAMSFSRLAEGLEPYRLGVLLKERYQELLKDIIADAVLGRSLGVNGTPTVFVNGVRLPTTSARTFDLAMRYEIQELLSQPTGH